MVLLQLLQHLHIRGTKHMLMQHCHLLYISCSITRFFLSDTFCHGCCLCQDGLGPSVSLFLSDVETVTWQQQELTSVAGKCDRLLVTEGDKGAKQYMQGQSAQVPPTKVSRCSRDGVTCR
jgi:hypothetical protein